MMGDQPALQAGDQVVERQRLGDVAQEARHVLDVEEDARDQDHRHEDRVHDRRRGLEVGDRVRERHAERGEADHSERHEHRELDPVRGPAQAEHEPPGEDHDRDLDRGVGDRVQREAAEVDAARERRAAHPLEHPLLAQEGQVVGERGERRRHHAHAGDAGHDDVELVALAADDRAEQGEEDQRQQEVEECGTRVAPEEVALEAVLAPEQRERLRHPRSAPGRSPRDSAA